MKNTSRNYKSGIKPVWCPGCGDYGVLNGLEQAFADLDIAPENIITVSGIGCSGRFSHYLNTYSLHGTHGRAVPTAMGAKAARPDLTVVCVGGDGDGLGIGGGHIPHAARKNVDMTYILIDNRIYGLTKGQTSPTTPIGVRTKTAPYGAYELPMEPLAMFLSYGTSFIARTSPLELKRMAEIMKAALTHKGFSIVYVLSPCVTFPVLPMKALREMLVPLPDDYDRENRLKAYEYAYNKEHLYTGIFYQEERPVMEDYLQEQIQKSLSYQKAGTKLTVEELLKSYA
ncbi:2-oxoacid:ferredoxin oxidoreductase subunit beta [bacterium]|nr:2-oxoacid:ferredoxin oxidoreductase subunit beta [bacterium]